MVGTAVVGIIMVVFGVAVSWRLIGDINSATQDTLEVTVDSLDSLEATVDLADQLIGSTSGSLDSVETALGTVSDSFSTGSDTMAAVGDLAETAEPALRDAASTLRDLETIGNQLDTALSGLSALPLGFDYDPDTGLGDTFGRLAGDIEPLPDSFAETAASLGEFEATVDQLRSDVEALEAEIHSLNEDLAGSEELIATYRQNVDDAQEVAQRSGRDLDQDQTLLRLVLVAAGLNFAVAQIVPLWVGWELQDNDAEGVIDLYGGSPDPGRR
jgi:methyl-accepting chemotaxis protein